MVNKVEITPWFFLMGALAFLLLPLRWLMGAILAAAVHEAFHGFAVFLCGGKVLAFSPGVFGAKIEAPPMGILHEALCALAGPVGSFSMVLIREYFPEAALCGVIQGAYNLLPLYGLDGGKILACLLPEPVCVGIRMFALVFLTGLGVLIMTFNQEIGVILLATIWIPSVRRKFSCKGAG